MEVFPAGNLLPRSQDARGPQRHQAKSRPLPVSLLPRAGLTRRVEKDERPPRIRTPNPARPRRLGFSPLPAVPAWPGRPSPGCSAPGCSGRASARLRFSARRRYGDSHETPAAPTPANGGARRGETRTSLIQDGGASVASSRAGGKPAKPSKAAAREETEGTVAAVGGGPDSFRCCYGCCHAARVGRTSLPRGVIMLTEVSGDGGQCLPVKWEGGRRQPVRDHHLWPVGSTLRLGFLGWRSCGDPTSAPRVGAVLTQQSPTASGSGASPFAVATRQSLLALDSRLLSVPPNSPSLPVSPYTLLCGSAAPPPYCPLLHPCSLPEVSLRGLRGPAPPGSVSIQGLSLGQTGSFSTPSFASGSGPFP
ncbi:hypothetical protein H920_13484 [Fukomys damarensis]|uniref:Uncharacterized protein n=1 Tax=Fukomys damarensis TaxID=885580 RepID=A0A091DQK5_FUKDA|nr:hypothetical protein H920_13484 [Fukomys damarensis]